MKLGDLFPYWEDVREAIKDAVRGIDPESLDASPAEEVGSIGLLLRDLIYMENFWLGQVVSGAGTASRSDYNRSRLPTAEAIILEMDSTRARTESLMSGMTARDLERHFAVPDGRMMSLLSILWVLFMDEIHCKGQISMLLRWLGREPIEV
jgi:uncharacterized damage-inducible protein DinB